MITVIWSHPAVLNGTQRTSQLEWPAEGTVAEAVARAFLPFGIEGLDALTVHEIYQPPAR